MSRPAAARLPLALALRCDHAGWKPLAPAAP